LQLKQLFFRNVEEVCCKEENILEDLNPVTSLPVPLKQFGEPSLMLIFTKTAVI
jgi:hypothetical protein